jgi:hypothetical protein
VNTPVVSHITDNCTQRLRLFSGIKVKPENNDLKEAEQQITIWTAANLCKKMELGHLAIPVSDVADNATSSADKVGANVRPLQLVEPALTIIGSEHTVYYACPFSAEGDIRVLGPDEKFAPLTTCSVQGIFKLLRFYERMLKWGIGKEASKQME